MFPWNIAKSAEAMFSRWAVKRVCKFLLKKKLGQFILGDIDLNQLDVQLTAGTIQLSDLALNVDYLNLNLGLATPVMVKEGSIGSLLVTMPWKGEGCQIVMDELELVFAPHVANISHGCTETCALGEDGKCNVAHDMKKVKHVSVDNAATAAMVDVHEGVKTIAKMVKWLLTSFHVRIEKMIVAFDPCLNEERDVELCKTLVLRIAEAECGTCISEDVDPNSSGAADNFLGLSRLTNFVKFEGVTLEFLQMDGINKQAPIPSASGTTSAEWLLGCSSNATTTIVSGERGGFSGTLKLSIPWKNGSLDISKVDADAFIDSLELKFQPSSIKCFLFLWDTLKDTGKDSEVQIHQKETESIYYNAASNCHSSTMGPFVPAADYLLSNHKCFSGHVSSMGKETVKNALLPESHLISDWVPSSVSDIYKDRTPEEPDFGASMDQFFECFDGLRSSQSALGNSGMWNWTCSVFSAITAASNLASGSLHIQSEQQHVQTNLRATISGISLLLNLVDEDTDHLCDSLGPQANSGSHVHYIGAKFQQMLLVLQVCPREINFEVTVQHIELADHYSSGDGIMDIGCHGCRDDIKSHFVLIREMQDAVEDALPPFCSSVVKKSCECVAGDVPCGIMDGGTSNYRSVCRNDESKVILFKTSGSSWCQSTLNSSLNGSFSGPKSWSLKLPPFVLWVNFPLLSVLSDLLKKVGNSFEVTTERNLRDSEASGSKYRPSSQGYTEKNSYPQVTSLSPKEYLRGNIFIPNARVILCFPFDKGEYCSSYSCWEQFIAFDFSSSSNLSEEYVQAASSRYSKNSKKRFPLFTASSLHLNLGNLNIYWINSTSKATMESDSFGMWKMGLFAQNMLSITDKTSHPFVVSLLWQEGPVTGPWIAKNARSLAASEDLKSREKFMEKGYEFASVSTMKDAEDFNTYLRQEIILSSAFLLHARLPTVMVNLSRSRYNDLQRVLLQVNYWLASIVSDTVGSEEEFSQSQTSILLECDYVEISINLEGEENVKSSIQSELPGSWHGFKLQVQKFEFLSVSNIGGIKDANLLWFAHGEGSLWGSITGVQDRDILLITCSNSTMGRGDGEGSNVLFSSFSGSDIIHFWDPENCCSHMSITVRCGTIVAVGGRLDWLESISSFFSSPSSDTGQVGENGFQKGSDTNSFCGSSFVLSLVDIGLSYEPFLPDMIVDEGCDSKFSSVNLTDKMGEKNVACLLAASCFKISNKVVADSINRDYKIRVKDLGLLLSAVSGPWNVGDYSVPHLRKIGYVKVAKEANLEALLGTDCENDLSWQLECAESHIVLETCDDTAAGLICLVSQLQQLFAPDVEESVVHLQTRWNNVKQAQESDVNRALSNDSAPSTSQYHTSSVDARGSGVVNLMDEICEDEFNPGSYSNDPTDICESHVCNSLNDILVGDGCNSRVRDKENCSADLSFSRSVPVITLESSDTPRSQKNFPWFIEEYFLSDLCHASEFSLKKQSSNEVPKFESNYFKDRDAQVGNSGWYGGASLRILENHVSEVSELACSLLSVEDKEHGKGRVLFKNINILWRMYAGSDWHGIQKNVQHPTVKCGRDNTKCLELALSGVHFQYDIFPEGKIFVSRLSLSVQDFCLSDNSKIAPWKLVLGYYQSKNRPRKSSSKAFKLDLEAVRPDPSTPLEEYRLRIAFLPMRLHLHQSQLNFLISFFGGKSSSADSSLNAPQDSSEVGIQKRSTTVGGQTINEEALLPYFQKFEILPLLVRVDYSPCSVDLAALRGGKYVELVNLVPWKGVELELKNVQGVGVYGWSCVCETIVGEWLEDISQNQIHKLLKGLPPIRSLVTVGASAAKLVSLPLKSYKKDHRLVKGMQRGTIAFLRSISLEAIGLGVHLAAGAHDILLQAEYILTSIPPSVPWPAQNRGNTNVRSNQPQDARQGIRQAFESLSDGIGKSASALVRTPMKRYQQGAGVGSAFATAVQAAPAAAVAPVSAAALAVRCALLGVRNSLDPEHKKESMDKYSGATQPREFSG